MATIKVRNLSTDMLAIAMSQLKQLIEAQESEGAEPDEIWPKVKIAQEKVSEWEAYAKRSIRDAA